jgi:ubiquinone/menaquinone biosynthesis C-methylase UbiE
VSDERFRCSFDSVADTYERTRPGYSDAAIEWVAQRYPLSRVLDLGAGTGKLTRQLVAHGAEVIAVEPGEAMRAVLERMVPEATSLAGSAESIPLPDASVDVVTAAQAFHWFRTEEALAEIHRVLKPGGGCALISNEWDDKDQLVRELGEILARLRPDGTHRGDQAFAAIESSPLFGDRQEQQFPHGERLDADGLVGLMSSISAVAAASPAEQSRVEAEVRALVRTAEVDLPMNTKVTLLRRV